MDRASMATITNPDDMNAIEAALKLKDETGCEVTVVSMGPRPRRACCRSCWPWARTRPCWCPAVKFGGSDTYATSQILAAALKRSAWTTRPSCSAAVRPSTATPLRWVPRSPRKLNLPQVTYVSEIKAEEEDHRAADAGGRLHDHRGGAALPADLHQRSSTRPRYMSVGGIVEAYSKPYEVYDFNTLKDDPLIDLDTIGLKGSPTNVYKSFSPR